MKWGYSFYIKKWVFTVQPYDSSGLLVSFFISKNRFTFLVISALLSTTIYLWLISLTASKELSILLLKLLECR